MRILISTAPKAGTYFMASFLRHLGFGDTYWHVGAGSLVLTGNEDKNVLEYNRRSDLLQGYRRFIKIDTNDALTILPDGMFCVSHLPPHMISPHTIGELKVISVFRDVRTALPSEFFYIAKKIYDHPNFKAIFSSEDTLQRKFFRFLELIMPTHSVLWRDLYNWRLYKNAEVFTFENLFDQQYLMQICERIRTVLELDLEIDAIAAAFQKAMDEDTPTKNKVRDRDMDISVWSPESEQLFESFGGHEFNKKMRKLIAEGY